MNLDPILFRALERILVVLTGGLSIALGYRLFLAMPQRERGEGKLELPGGVSIFISRVGPGVFFALFGAVVVSLSLHESITYSRQSPTTGEVVSYGGLNPGTLPVGDGDTEADRAEVRLAMEFLNTVDVMLKDDLSQQELVRAERQRREIKLALMRSVWGGDWGDWELFRIWAEGGAPDPVPTPIAAAAEYFRTGEDGRP